MNSIHTRVTSRELHDQLASELPGRELLLTISLLGIPLAGVDGVSVNVDTTGPGWLIAS
jgi:hypothetical protein